MTSGKKTKATRNSVAAARSSVVAAKPKPWGTIIAVIAVLALAGGVFGYAYSQISANNAKEAALAKWKPSEENKDPSKAIPGIVVQDPAYPAGKHVTPDKRVAYDKWPPFGGPHDQSWADCMGTVYEKPVRTENMVHGLEHGAVWIAYNPDQVKDDALTKLKAKAEGQQFTMLSPFPGLDKPISLQSWSHQLKVESADDERIDQFISSLRRNQYTYPEVGASCENPQFIDAPAPFVAEAPGADAEPMTGGTTDPSEAPVPPSGSTPPSS
jgi:hypothetical protein